MNLQSFRQNLGFLIGIAVLFTLASSPTVAQEGASVSGRVVDESGDPVPGISIAIQPYKVMGNIREEGIVPLWERQADSEGRFSIWPIAAAESVRFVVKGDQKEINILSIKLGELTLYPNNRSHSSFNKIRLSLAAGTEIENAVITVKTDVRRRSVHASFLPMEHRLSMLKFVLGCYVGLWMGMDLEVLAVQNRPMRKDTL